MRPCRPRSLLLQLQLAGERDPNVSTLISHCLPSWQGDNMPAPFGNRSPDLLPPGPELSRGFSRSASRPHGQVVGGAITIWPFSRPKASRSQHWRGTRPASPASGSFQISACLRLDVYVNGPDRGQRRSCCRAAVVMFRFPQNPPQIPQEKT